MNDYFVGNAVYPGIDCLILAQKNRPKMLPCVTLFSEFLSLNVEEADWVFADESFQLVCCSYSLANENFVSPHTAACRCGPATRDAVNDGS